MPWRIRKPGRLDRGPLKKDEILAQIDAGEISSLALISKAKHAPWEAITLAGDPGDEAKGQ